MLLLKNAEVYAPDRLGKRDVLIGGGTILAVEKDLSPNLPDVRVYDAEGKILAPGFLDQHVHIIGGGGEGGPHTRTPELLLSDAVKAGVTTLVGLLGTDGVTRTMEALIAKTKSLNNEGITAFCLTSAYQYPPVTLTGSVMRDIVYISEVLGCKLAISDHRGSHPTRDEIIRLVSDVRMAGLLSGKPGILHIHTGAAPEGIEPIMEIVRTTDIPPRHFRPTHLGRHLEQAIAFTRLGGYSDITAGEDTPAMIHQILEEAAVERITMSSDSNGSMPKWDGKRERIIGMGVGKMTDLYRAVRRMAAEENVPLERVLPLITSNVAKALDLYPKKGAVQAGSDADLVLLDQDLNIDGVIARGRCMMLRGEVLVKGTFEE